MGFIDRTAILGRKLTVEDFSLIGEVVLYSEIHDEFGSVKQSETVFVIGNPIKCTKEVKIFAPPPRHYTSTPKIFTKTIKEDFTLKDIVKIVNGWVESENYTAFGNWKVKNNVKYREKRIVYLRQA